jgi:hypothetical protein
MLDFPLYQKEMKGDFGRPRSEAPKKNVPPGGNLTARGVRLAGLWLGNAVDGRFSATCYFELHPPPPKATKSAEVS